MKEEQDLNWFNGIDLIPPDIIDIFIKRINKRFEMGANKNHPSVQRELEMLKQVNGRIPPKVQELLDSK